MSWLSDIAGKAEQMLEKLDKNAAAALSLETPNRAASRAIEVDPEEHDTIVPQEPENTTSPESPGPRQSTLAQLRGSRSSVLKTTRRKPPQDEDKNLLMTYLNQPSPSESSNKSKSSDIPETQDSRHLKTENTFLKSEIQSLNFEISRLLQKAKQGERDQQELMAKQARIAELESSLHVTRSEAQRLGKELQELQHLKSESHFELSSEIERLQRSQREQEARASSLAETVARLETETNEQRTELIEVKDNFEKYRTRAQSVLNEKDNLIARLRSGSLEEEAAEQLENEEIVLLRQGSQQMSSELAALRALLASREEEKLQASRARVEVQTSLEALAQRLATAEHDLAYQKEENQRLREELHRAECDVESLKAVEPAPSPPPQRAWSQHDAAADYVLDLDAKVRTLTATLVKKQQAVELLTAERNAMRLQLEKTEHKLQDATRIYDRGILSDMNTTDDAKARLVPGSLRERLGLSETGMTRGVTRGMRRAYTALGMATGNLVRRHPAMRLGLVLYLVILHLWVFGVLFSHTPESHAQSASIPH